MIASACVRIYTKPVNKTPWRPGPIESTMYDIPCHRHADAFYIISQFMAPEDIDKSRTEQGFLTHDGRFLNRYDAMQEADRWRLAQINYVQNFIRRICGNDYST